MIARKIDSSWLMDAHVLENCCSLLVSLRKREKNWRLPYVVSNITTARRMCYLTKRTCFTSSERRTVTGMISPVDYHTLSVTNGHLFVAPATYKQSYYKRHLLLSGYLRNGPSDSLTLKSYHKQTLNHRPREIQTPDTSPKRTFFSSYVQKCTQWRKWRFWQNVVRGLAKIQMRFQEVFLGKVD